MSSASFSEQPSDDLALDQIGPALSRLRRRAPASSRDLSRNLVLNVVADAPGEMTVGGLAAEMGVAQPVASRTVAACIAEGLLRRGAAPAGGRPAGAGVGGRGAGGRAPGAARGAAGG